MSFDEPVGMACPICAEPPLFVLGGDTQAFCGNEDCRVISWDPTKSARELLASERAIVIEVDPQGGAK